MSVMPATDTFKNAIRALGGQQAAAACLGRKQPTISGYVTEGNAPAEICMMIEVETGRAPLGRDPMIVSAALDLLTFVTVLISAGCIRVMWDLRP